MMKNSLDCPFRMITHLQNTVYIKQLITQKPIFNSLYLMNTPSQTLNALNEDTESDSLRVE